MMRVVINSHIELCAAHAARIRFAVSRKMQYAAADLRVREGSGEVCLLNARAYTFQCINKRASRVCGVWTKHWRSSCGRPIVCVCVCLHVLCYTHLTTVDDDDHDDNAYEHNTHTQTSSDDAISLCCSRIAITSLVFVSGVVFY